MNIAPLTMELQIAILALTVFIAEMLCPKRKLTAYLSLVGLVAIFLISFRTDTVGVSFWGSFVSDGLSVFLKRVFILAGIIGILGSAHSHKQFSERVGEYYFLILLSILGMCFLVSSRELILLFVSFELMSIPLFVLSAFYKGRKGSESALKLFIFGTISAVVLLFGLSILYLLVGSTFFKDIVIRLRDSVDPLLLVSFAFILAGFGFKVALVPFHMWVPDVYEGAPTPFVAFLSVAPKVAGLGIIFRVFAEVINITAIEWVPFIVVLSAVTMITGNLLAIPQSNIKRLLGYSGIAHIGYILLGLASRTEFGLGMALFYFVAYTFSNMGAFLVVESIGINEGSDELNTYNGLAQRKPLLALSMLVFLLSLGGIPFVIGFWAKLEIFLAALRAGLVGLVLLGALLTVVALFYYLNVARKMYIELPTSDKTILVPQSLNITIIFTSLAVVILGILPFIIIQPALDAVKGLLPM